MILAMLPGGKFGGLTEFLKIAINKITTTAIVARYMVGVMIIPQLRYKKKWLKKDIVNIKILSLNNEFTTTL